MQMRCDGGESAMSNEAVNAGKLSCTATFDQSISTWPDDVSRQARLQDGNRLVDIEQRSDKSFAFTRARRAAKEHDASRQGSGRQAHRRRGICKFQLSH